MSYELHDLDRNCNDCRCMARNFDQYNIALARHNKNLRERFDRERQRLLSIGNAETLREANKMKFQPNSKINEGFGHCTKFDKPVDFISGICQIHTQGCFEHRTKN